MHRDEAIERIRTALRRRSGKPWSVTGGRGTAWGWITIEAPPRRRTGHSVVKEGRPGYAPEDFEYRDTGEPNGSTTPAELEELAKLLGVERVHFQGESIPASNDYYQEYVDRAEGGTPRKIGTPYWD